MLCASIWPKLTLFKTLLLCHTAAKQQAIPAWLKNGLLLSYLDVAVAHRLPFWLFIIGQRWEVLGNGYAVSFAVRQQSVSVRVFLVGVQEFGPGLFLYW
jgi:hypothetical protein